MLLAPFPHLNYELLEGNKPIFQWLICLLQAEHLVKIQEILLNYYPEKGLKSITTTPTRVNLKGQTFNHSAESM